MQNIIFISFSRKIYNVKQDNFNTLKEISTCLFLFKKVLNKLNIQYQLTANEQIHFLYLY